jgi:hypothetical protein
MFTVHKAPSTGLTAADINGADVVCTTDLAEVNQCEVVD